MQSKDQNHMIALEMNKESFEGFQPKSSELMSMCMSGLPDAYQAFSNEQSSLRIQVPPKRNLINQRFNRLLVIGEAPSRKHRAYWTVLCDCGTTKESASDDLLSGDLKSCGCLNRELKSQRAHKMHDACRKYAPHITSARSVWRQSYTNPGDDISFDDFFRLSQMNCSYCGAEPSNCVNSAKSSKSASETTKAAGDFIYNGLDRIDSSLPHTLNNITTACKTCNYAKRDLSVDEFKAWLKRVYERMAA